MVKTSGFFVFGVLVGIVGALAVERLRRENDPEDVELLSKRVSEHLRQLEDRLENVKALKHAEAV